MRSSTSVVVVALAVVTLAWSPLIAQAEPETLSVCARDVHRHGTPVGCIGLLGAKAISSAEYSNCILMTGGLVDCWGDLAHVSPAADSRGDAVAIALGGVRYADDSGRHLCILRVSADVDCVGRWHTEGTPVDGASYAWGDAIAISSGEQGPCVLTDTGNVDCFPFRVDGAFTSRGDRGLGDAVAVSGGPRWRCVLTMTGGVDCVGFAEAAGPLDDAVGDVVAVDVGHSNRCLLRASGIVSCDGYQPGDGVVFDDSIGDASAVALGLYHTCILTSTGNVRCHGPNYFGEGDPYLVGDAVAVDVGYYHTCILRRSGTVDCRGHAAEGANMDYTALTPPI